MMTKRLKIMALGMLAASSLSACVTQAPSFGEGIGYREARFAEITAMREYRSCRDHALELDRDAQSGNDPAKFIASARMIESFETKLSPDAAGLAKDERMRTYALSVQNYLKGGDVEAARSNLEKFSATFPDQDLYFADGSSFVQTMEVLLGLRGAGAIGRYSDTNINGELKAELRRVRHWETN